MFFSSIMHRIFLALGLFVFISLPLIDTPSSFADDASVVDQSKSETSPRPNLSETGVRYEFPDRLVVVLMGDPQLPMTEDSPAHVKKAMDDIITLKHDFVAILGDLIQPVGGDENKIARYEMFKHLVLQPMVKPAFSISGNADSGVGLKYYHQYTGLPNHYTIKRRGIRFIFLGTTKLSGEGRHICHIGKEGLAYLEAELEKDKESTTVIFHHSPMKSTTYMSGPNARNSTRPVHHPRNMFLGESDRMRELIKANPNIILYACGHTHIQYGATDTDGRGAYHEEDGVLHVAVGASANNRGSSILTIENNGITVRVRNHEKKMWDDRFEKKFPVKTTLDTTSK